MHRKIEIAARFDLQYALRYFARLEFHMETATVSSKFQVVIPQKVLKALGIKPGQKVQVIS